jgi:C1A family cysteine protease
MPLLTLTEVQREITSRQAGWQAGATSLSDLTPEMRARRLGLTVDEAQRERLKQAFARAVYTVGRFPPRWDWRDVEGHNWMTPIRDQGTCGACVAFGTVGALEGMVKYAGGDPKQDLDLSEAHLFFCGCGDCCSTGWWPPYALDYVQSHGVPDEDCFRYQAQYQPCSKTCADWSARVVRITGYKEKVTLDERKAWLTATGPMVGAMAVYDDFFHYQGGVYRPVSSELVGYHAIAVAGYDDSLRAWLCKNSWGAGWGEAGWFRLAYGTCEIDTSFPFWGIEQVLRPVKAPVPQKGCNPLARLRRARPGG